MIPNHEYVLLEANAASAGSEMKSETGIVLGKRQTGEIPEYATVIAVGKGVENENIKIGAKVPITNGRMTNVPDPRVLDGVNIPEEERRKLSVTHWKNITVTY